MKKIAWKIVNVVELSGEAIWWSIIGDTDYTYTYKQGEIVEDKKGIGFFCYKTKKDCEYWFKILIPEEEYRVGNYKIIKVELLDKVCVPESVSSLFFNLKPFYNGYWSAKQHPLGGTIVCKKIKILG